jgi:hypothetical protein
MTTVEATVADWVQIVRAEFLEFPGLNLTKKQVQRLWGLDPDTCDAVLEALVATRFLRRIHDGYVRTDMALQSLGGLEYSR